MEKSFNSAAAHLAKCAHKLKIVTQCVHAWALLFILKGQTHWHLIPLAFTYTPFLHCTSYSSPIHQSVWIWSVIPSDIGLFPRKYLPRPPVSFFNSSRILVTEGNYYPKVAATQKSRSFSRANKPFYSCLFTVLAFERKRGWAWLCMIQTNLFFSCPCGQVSMTRTWFRREKRWGLYQNKVNSVHNCKWAFTKATGAVTYRILKYLFSYSSFLTVISAIHIFIFQVVLQQTITISPISKAILQ